MDTVLWLCSSLPTETLQWLSSLPILMQKSCWRWQRTDTYIISLCPHLHAPFSQSLISLVVSVDVKHHVYLLTSLWMRPRRACGTGDTKTQLKIYTASVACSCFTELTGNAYIMIYNISTPPQTCSTTHRQEDRVAGLLILKERQHYQNPSNVVTTGWATTIISERNTCSK